MPIACRCIDSRHDVHRCAIPRGSLTRRRLEADTSDMGRSVAIGDVLDKHHIPCPQCACREAVVVLDPQFDVYWQCVDCECRWAASEEESVLLHKFASKAVH